MNIKSIKKSAVSIAVMLAALAVGAMLVVGCGDDGVSSGGNRCQERTMPLSDISDRAACENYVNGANSTVNTVYHGSPTTVSFVSFGNDGCRMRTCHKTGCFNMQLQIPATAGTCSNISIPPSNEFWTFSVDYSNGTCTTRMCSR